ncbi:hypothetical protein C0995_011706 [Termitomyces sp. Mi166|nr:hypothetical protein C0995_011706 [Termitomyces sp. Mi166\
MSSPKSVPIYTLNNGVSIPAVAHGAWAPIEARSEAKEWLLTALRASRRFWLLHTEQLTRFVRDLGWLSPHRYRTGLLHILDTEEAVGEVIKKSGIPREEIFITSKLSPLNQHRVAESFEESLKALSVDYIDLARLPFLFTHHPANTLISFSFTGHNSYFGSGDGPQKNPDGTWRVREDITFHQAWAELEKLLEAGKIKAIGVSNFSIKTLEELAATAKITPAVNQVELHPYLVQEDLRVYCDKKRIILSAYTPSGQLNHCASHALIRFSISGYDTVRKDPLIVELAAKYRVTPNQITLAWHLARHIIIIPKSSKEEHQKENINVGTVSSRPSHFPDDPDQLPTLQAEDVIKISRLDRNQRLCNAADEHGQVYGWSLERLGW